MGFNYDRSGKDVLRKPEKKIHLLGGVRHLLIINGKLLNRGGKKEENVAEMKVIMIRVLTGQVKKKS